MRTITKTTILSVTLTFILSGCAKNEEFSSWRFINAPDLHNVEGFSKVWEDAWNKQFDGYEEYRKSSIDKLQTDFKAVQERHDAEMLVSPGDCLGARWDDRRGRLFQEKFRSVPQYANLNDNEIIMEATSLCYTGLNEVVYSSGFKEFLMVVGDHELGDNPWPVGSVVPESLPVFRQGFANQFTMKAPNGQTRFDKPIGKIPSRPIGTIYENTSNAVQYKNVLFITLDVFRYDGKDIELGEEGLICGDVAGKHLEWLESVLKEAKEISSIDHIIVQSHLPIIYPVKKYASSGMLMSGAQDNILLKVMRKYNVDLYLAGEVHMNTVTRDPESDLVQFVGRGNNLSNYAVIEVEKNALLINSYKLEGSLIGTLTIDKSKGETQINGEGDLKLVKPDGLQIHWDFENKLRIQDFDASIGSVTIKPWLSTNDKESNESFVLLNKGGFGEVYSLFGVKAGLSEGVRGNCIEIGKETQLSCVAMGPMYADFKRTISFWVKSSSDGRRGILNANCFWSKRGQFFNVGLNEGLLELSLRPEIYATAKSGKINDGLWHHIAVVVPIRDARLNNCKLYIDGEPINEVNYKNGSEKIYTEQGNWMAIATQSERSQTDLAQSMNVTNFEGYLDEFCIWTRVINGNEIKQIYQEGMEEIKRFHK